MKWFERDNQIIVQSTPPRWFVIGFWVALVLLIAAVIIVAAGWIEAWSPWFYAALALPILVGIICLRSLALIPMITAEFNPEDRAVKLTYRTWLARQHVHTLAWQELAGIGIQEAQMAAKRTGYRLGLLTSNGDFFLLEFLPSADQESRARLGQNLADRFGLGSPQNVPADQPARMDGRVA